MDGRGEGCTERPAALKDDPGSAEAVGDGVGPGAPMPVSVPGRNMASPTAATAMAATAATASLA